MKTFFITGGEGFIGYHLCTQLLQDSNNKVITYDAHKHFTSSNEGIWMSCQMYRRKSLQNENLIRIKGDATDRVLLEDKLNEYKPDVVIHLSALPIEDKSNEYPEEAKRNILDSVITVLDVLRRKTFNVDRFVYISSSMVYGDFKKDLDGKVIPANESQQCEPVGLYGAMKLSGEIITKAYNRRFGIPYVIIRPSAVYGPTDCNRRVTEIFIQNALNGKDLVLENGGHQQLDFTYVKDTVQGITKASNSKNALNETFNITRGEGRTLRELAQIISKMIPETKIIEKNVKEFRAKRGALDISKAKTLLKYEPKYSLEDGMKEYLNFIKSVDTINETKKQ
jgi:UDP-glucose 4-epimerase